MSLVDKIVIRMSKVSDDNVSSENKEKLLKIHPQIPNFTPEKKESIEEPSFRKIKNGSDEYDVVDRTEYLYYGYNNMIVKYGDVFDDFGCHHTFILARQITVMHENNEATLCIVKQATSSSEIQSATYEEYAAKIKQQNADMFFNKDKNRVECGQIDLNDINAIRYACRKNEKMSYFLDKFVIVTPEERKAYREYAEKMDKVEKIRLQQKQKENREKETKVKLEEKKRLYKEEKIKEQEKKAIQEIAKKEAIKQRKFYGK
ncbi:MAG: hypothetical protein NC218_05080 [Acetobacter sp.]|nr:hypothetical protein [Acetobacter sp.]